MASSSRHDDTMDADNYQIDDEEMELMIRSMNAGGTIQSEYIEEGCNEEFDWGSFESFDFSDEGVGEETDDSDDWGGSCRTTLPYARGRLP